MGDVTHEQVNLMLRLYDMRREPRLREAREWFGTHFNVKTPEEFMLLCPPGSQENAFMRMVISYWEMVSSIVNRGLIDEDLFFESNGEQWMVFEKIKPILPAWRTMFKNPMVFSQLEENVRRLEAWREKKAPGSTEAMRQMMAQMAQATQKTKTAGN
ncbi:MAG: hypothetical protein WB780_15075 [Candidatus Acidiferrales bacterium]